jgi:16S rRNA (adenine1518-N6/adenine1519-N6)-dimethyltransferase
VGRPLGQHFLFDRSILDRIARAACPEPAGTVIEIGPGPGSLTEALLPRTRRLIAVELDSGLAAALRLRHAGDGRFTLVEGDILQTDLTPYAPAVVCGNIPYYITSPIIGHVLGLGANLLRAVFLVQREVALRLAAAPRSRDYGYLSVATQFRARVEVLFTVKAATFRPPPKVDSAVVRLTPHEGPPAADPEAFPRFAAACFRHKRKTLKNNLSAAYPAIAALPEASLRAEQLPIEALLDLYARLTA